MEKVRLIVEGEELPWVEGQRLLRIGRAPDSELRVDRPGVSRAHATIRRISAGVFEVQDEGSSNGTRCRGRKVVGPTRIAHGDRLALGGVQVRFEIAGGGANGVERRSLPQRARVLGLVVAVVVIVATAAARVLAGGPGLEAAPEEQGILAFDLEELEGDEVFGVGLDVSHETPRGIRFRWSLLEGGAEGRRISLRYAAASIDEGSLEIHLNGAPIGLSPPTGEGWRELLEVVLPAQALSFKGENVIEIVPSLEGAPREWQIKRPSIEVEPLPGCASAACLEEAERLSAIGGRSLDARALDPRNLFEGWVALRQALLFLEAGGGAPALRKKVEREEAGAREALDRRCGKLRFTVTRSVALGEEAAAWDAAESMVREFGGEAHPCHEVGRHLLRLLDP